MTASTPRAEDAEASDAAAESAGAARPASAWRDAVAAAVRATLRLAFRLAWGVRPEGLAHLQGLGTGTAGAGAVVTPNHASFADGLMLAAFLPGRPLFAVAPEQLRRRALRLVAGFVEMLPLEPEDPRALRPLVRAAQAGRLCVVFPEGRITPTGGLMKIQPGVSMVADRAGVPVVPARIEGPELTPLGRLASGPRRWFPPVRLAFGAPVRLEAGGAPAKSNQTGPNQTGPNQTPGASTGRARREALHGALKDLMERAVVELRPREAGPEALLRAARAHGPGRVILGDGREVSLTYRGLFRRAAVLSPRLGALDAPSGRVGVLLPTAPAAMAVPLALWLAGRTPAMLNFTAGPAALASACRTADLRAVLTATRFLDQAGLGAEAAAIEAAGVRLIRLDGLRFTIADKLRGLAPLRWAARAIRRGRAAGPDDAALVLFTSGSEGAPKGVVLTHDALLANCRQTAAAVGFGPGERMLNALPAFHAFGFTAGLVLPLVNGVFSAQCPSPLRVREVAATAYNIQATATFGTDAFLAGWGRAAEAEDFRTMRLVFAGAEPLRASTRELWLSKFGVLPYEGYGATEAAPVIAVNAPGAVRDGRVGRFLPGIEWRLDPVEGISEGGRLVVRGPNVMQGYLLPDETGGGADGAGRGRGRSLPAALPGGWHDTGDIVTVDADGFVRIVGRAKRFAKIGGEMVSLALAESLAASLWPETRHAAFAQPDPAKGERVVLLTEQADATRDALIAEARRRGAPEIALPRAVIVVDAVPATATGKIDYVAARRLLPDAAPARGA